MGVDTGKTANLIDLINLFIALGIGFAFILSVWYIFVGALSFITSGGSEDKIKSAVNTIRYAMIGLLMTILSIAFIYLVGNLLDIAVSEYINFDRMIEQIMYYGEKMVNGPNS